MSRTPVQCPRLALENKRATVRKASTLEVREARFATLPWGLLDKSRAHMLWRHTS